MKKSMERPAFLTPESLKRWIPELIAAGKMYRFYKTPEFKTLREEIICEAHGECEDCRAKKPMKITPAVTVHHDRTVKDYPELALARYWIDEKGRKHKQLWALCEDCHNARHDRFGYSPAPSESKLLTPERW